MTLLDHVGKRIGLFLRSKARRNWRYEAAANAFSYGWPWSWRRDGRWKHLRRLDRAARLYWLASRFRRAAINGAEQAA